MEASGGTIHPAQAKLSRIVQAMPVDWHGSAEDIADACLFLCSEEARHINGAVLSVDGGMCVC